MQDKSLFFKKSEAFNFVEMRRADRSNACYHIHSHDEFSFGVIDAGAADYLNLRKKNVISVGSTVTINPGDAHACNPKYQNWSYRMLFIDSHWMGELQQALFRTHGHDYLPFPSLGVNDKQSFMLFDRLFNSLLVAGDSEAETLLLEFIEYSFSSKYSLNPDIVSSDSVSLARIKEMILEQLASNISLDEFASESGLSRYHLIRSFKKAYGQSPHAFQIDQRIKHSKKLLKQGCSLVETAAALGFSDQSHFQRNFKKRLAVTPKHYQSFFC